MTDTTTAVSPYLLAAYEYAELGWHVVQGRAHEEKRPLRSGDAWSGTKDPELLKTWWDEHPNGLVGLGLGASGFLVIDVDQHLDSNGRPVDGFASFERLLETLRIDWDDLVHESLVSHSGGDGMHFIFQEPEIPSDDLKRLIGWLPGVDLLCGRSYLVLPPSYHPETGKPYYWDETGRSYRDGPGPLPPKLLEKVVSSLQTRLKGDGVAERKDASSVFREGSKAGSRNNDLTMIIGWLRRRLAPGPDLRERVAQQVEEWRDRCKPPYRGGTADLEFERTFSSAMALPHTDIELPNWGRPTPIAHDGRSEITERTTEGMATWAYPILSPYIRYSREEGMIYRWRGAYWQAGGPRHEDVPSLLDELGFCNALRRAVEVTTTRLMATEDDPRSQKQNEREIGEWEKFRVKMVEPRSLISTALRVVGHESLGVDRQTWDAIPQLLHVVNGAIDLETGIIHPHDSSRMNWSLARAEFDASTQPRDPASGFGLDLLGPAWRKMIQLITDSPELQVYLQCAFGVSLFGDNRAKAMFILHGASNNGKTTLLNAMMGLLGAGDKTYPMAGVGSYAGSVDKHVLCERLGQQTDQHPAGLAGALLRRMVVMSQEYNAQTDRLRLEVIKAITGNEIISARFMRQDFFELQAKCTPWMATNEVVHLGAFDTSIRTRIKPIELEGEILDHQQRPISMVMQELATPDERTQLLSWLVAGARACAAGQESLSRHEPAQIKEALDEMIMEQSSVLAWMDARCIALATGDRPDLLEQFKDRVLLGTSVQVLYNDYMIWLQMRNQPPRHQTMFTRDIKTTLKLPTTVKVRDTINDERHVMLPLVLKS